jgi:dTMP kinase
LPMFFLAFEGLDGSGKSSLMTQLQKYLEQSQLTYIKTREPGGTDLGDLLRELILTKEGPAPTPRTELLMYEASRAQHVDLVIKPALNRGDWVLCDRFSASSIAFQAGGRKISLDQVEWLNEFATEGLKPHLNILLDLTVEESQKRRQKRAFEVGEAQDRIESEAASFHERVRQGFLQQAQRFPREWLVMDAANSPDQLFQILLSELKNKKWLES